MNTGESLPIIHGRGTALNPPNRFETLRIEADLEHLEGDEEYLDRFGRPVTQYLVDASQSIIARNDSPDVGFTHSINAYRGCSHGCIYCYARPGHEYLGFSAGLDFETRIMVKPRAAELLRGELSSPKWRPTLLAMSGVTDCYQPIEKTLRLTRSCLEVLAEFRNPVGVITKNHLVTRDIDLLSELAKFDAARVFVSVTTLDEKLTAKMEPRTSVPKRRLAAIEALATAGITVGVLMAPVVPGLTDHEIPAVLKAAAEAGAKTAGYVPLRLPGAVAPLFEQWLEQHFPDRKDKVLNRVRALRGGKLNDPNFGSRMRGQGVWADQLKTIFDLSKRRAGLDREIPPASIAAFRRPSGPQMTMWD
ncbi:MAG TPA: PA0069 family radical SAM protein [Tepidisphaeraceae bacterium]|jgi:DNA repair photolyase|nr:PA0069 family radical SAM protein [Tepidisphaeraceae bacterium]